MNRIALVFDNALRPETTGVYVRRALGSWLHQGRITALEHFVPDELAQIPAGRFDLFFCVDDGLDYKIPEHLHPRVWWAIDTHLGFERCLERARQANWTFAAQRNGAERLRTAGIETAEWLPLACDPDLHGRRAVRVIHDVAFVGHEVGSERKRLLDLIQSQYPRLFRGQAYWEQLAAVYSGSKVVFNRSVADDVNMRVFEGLCSGSLLVTNRLPDNGLSELFREEEEFVAYDSDAELLDKLAFYLEHEDARQRVAAAGRAAVLNGHTYAERVSRIMERITTGSRRPVRSAVTDKASTYFEFDRPDVLALVPTDARRILDVGCGAGGLGAAIQRRQPAAVIGLELHPEAAARARSRLDHVFELDIESTEHLPGGEPFDCIICADVLEHLRSPEKVLRRLWDWLTPEGRLIASLPNVRNHTVVQSLLAGNWTYEPAGLLDADHVRFFTRREIEKLLFRTGFEIDEFQMVPGEAYQAWVEAGSPRDMRVGGLQVRAASRNDAAEFYAYQFLTRARKAERPDHGLTSIIIVTHNQLAYTRQCVESIRFRTDEPYEFVFVDNGSSDGTSEYLRSIPDATVIVNAENRGFPAAVNQGLGAARGDNLLLLNNDVVVTTAWLRRLLDALHADPATGLVGPVSNNVSGCQQVEIGYRQLAELDGWAWDRGRTLRGPAAEVDRLVGFCLLMKREVVNRIGLFDERFGIGNFEDDDFCRRARDAGYRTLMVADSFVHHFGSVTFRASGVDFGGLLAQNQQLYQKKWGSDGDRRAEQLIPRPAQQLRRPRPKFILSQGDDGSLRLRPNTIRLSLCMIVRDNADTIRPCLESIREWVDEMIVVDTGSTDATPDICRELGARVYKWAWCDDFAAARNESLRHARGEWLFWMDSDDTIPADCGRKLRELADGDHPEDLLGYVLQVHCPGRDRDEVTVVDHVKLFRNRPELWFEFRIHEQVLPSIRRAGGEVAWTDLYVVHSGSNHSPEGRRRKLERDFRLLHLELRERPEHPFALFNLGMTQADAGQHAAAVESLRRSIAASQPQESHLRKAYALLVGSLSQLDRLEEAWDAAERALERFPTDKELLFRQAMLHHRQGRPIEAERVYRRVIAELTPRHFASVDRRLGGPKARHNLAIVLEEQGRWQDAAREWEALTREQPNSRTAWRGLGESLLQCGDQAAAEQALHSMASHPELQPESVRLAARLQVARGDPMAAMQLLRNACRQRPGDLDLRQEWCRLSFQHASPQETEAALRDLLAASPQDAAAHHNLGTTLVRLGRFDQAAAAYWASLDLRPNNPETLRMLARTLGTLGRVEEVRPLWKQLARLVPGDFEAWRMVTGPS